MNIKFIINHNLIRILIIIRIFYISYFLFKMSKVLLLGMAPLPFEKERKIYGTGIRTWQFAKPLLEDGHKVCIVAYKIPSTYENNNKIEVSYPIDLEQHKVELEKYSFYIIRLKQKEFEDNLILNDIHDKFSPDCIVSATFYPSFIATKIKSEVPFWADLFGHVMAEAQAKAVSINDDEMLFHYWNQEVRIIDKADIFSCVSKRQENATIGELGLLGRLNKYTYRYDFTRLIPCAAPEEDFYHNKKVIRGIDVEEDDFVILYSGGYNTWVDVDTLFNALTMLMSENTKIKFISTGGEIKGIDEKTYPRFLKMIENSRFKDRFIMKGWIPAEDVRNYYFEANLGINVDKNLYEVYFGSKNRILEWMRAGLLVLSSKVCELSHLLDEKKLGFTYEAEDTLSLKNKITEIISNPDLAKERVKNAKKYVSKNLTYYRTVEPLREWVKNPKKSPDRGKERALDRRREEAFQNLERIVKSQQEMIKIRNERIEELEGLFHKKLIYRIFNYIKLIKKRIF